MNVHLSDKNNTIIMVLDCLPVFTVNKIEPRRDKTCLREFPTRSDTNRPAQLQKLARVLKILAIESRDIILSKQRTTKALIRLRGSADQTARMRRSDCAFVVRI